ncbi:MAG: PCRF domain-containing protein, partial [Actinomycetota bacterium]
MHEQLRDADLDRLRRVEEEYLTLEAQLADPEVLADPAQLRTLSKRYTDLGPVIEAFRRRTALNADVEAARELLDGASGDERAMLLDDITTTADQLVTLDDELRELMLPTDPNDGRNVIIEIRGAEGGEEANLFARDLGEMYRAFADRHGWSTTTLSASLSDMGGYNDLTMEVRGDTAWRNLKFEGGPHRVQRVPVTESQGRVHTSSATVSVMPEADEIDVTVDERDLDIDVYRASGPG